MHINRLLSLLIAASSFIQIQAQDICGIVTGEDGISPISLAYVVADNPSSGLLTDADGHFCIKTYDGNTLYISYMGYETQEVIADRSQVLHITMRRSSSVFQTVIINPEFILRDSFFSVGSGTSISQRQLRQLNHTDFNRVASTIAGINIQEEDGFGLRPNIGMRGSGSDRSSKITLMEDGILIAPAPYAAPAAYYFPTMGRMQGIEILKGTAQIPYGPNTTGGAVNLISAQFTDKPAAMLWVENGAFNTSIMHSRFSNTHGKFSYVAEFFHYGSDGFKVIDDRFNTGFKKSDVLVKLRYTWGQNLKQNLQLKLSKTDELSYETYLGVVRSDFNDDPYQRYAASQMDNFEGNHKQISLRYSLVTKKKFEFSAVAYRNTFHRNWYKLDKVTDTTGKSVGISTIVNAQSGSTRLLNVLRGNISSDSGLVVKANNRDYYSQGIQTNFGYQLPNTQIRQYIHGGVRLHQDGLDRFQWADNYGIEAGQMKLWSAGTPGTESNLLLDALALSGFVQYDVNFGKWQINPGIRYENIIMNEANYGKLDPERTGINQVDEENTSDVLIPGIGFKYTLNRLLSFLGGVHRGFTPASVDSGSLPELSINSELGFQFRKSGLNAKVVGFHTAYDNLLTSDAGSSGGSGSIKTFNGGEAISYGVEVEAGILAFSSKKLSIPINLSYTYTHAEFLSNFESDFDSWGEIKIGDNIPYVAPHSLNFAFSLISRMGMISVNNRYTNSVRTVAGQDQLDDENSIPSVFITDLNMQLKLGKNVGLLLGVNNLFNNTYAASTYPAGFRAGMPRYVHGGFRLTL
jgi:Fe(3+) dicitrate transport protein